MGLLLIYGLNTWLAEIMRAAGYPLGASLALLLTLNVGAVLGLLLAGRVADRVGLRTATVAWFGAAAVFLALLSIRFYAYGSRHYPPAVPRSPIQYFDHGRAPSNARAAPATTPLRCSTRARDRGARSRSARLKNGRWTTRRGRRAARGRRQARDAAGAHRARGRAMTARSPVAVSRSKPARSTRRTNVATSAPSATPR
jgi:hypothetical protein